MDKLELAKQIIAKAEAEKRSLTEDEVKEYDSIISEIKAIKENEKRAKELDSLKNIIDIKPEQEQRAIVSEDSKTIINTILKPEEKKMEKTEVRKAFEAFVRSAGNKMTEEQRTLVSTSNGIKMPLEVASEVQQVGSDDNFILKLAKKQPVKGAIEVAAITAYGGASIVAEGDNIGNADNTMVKKTLRALKIANFIPVSEEYIKTAENPDVWLGEAIREDLNEGLLKLALTGTGTGQPEGVFTMTSATVTSASASAITYPELVQLDASLAGKHRNGAVYVVHNTTEAVIRTIYDATSKYSPYQMGVDGKPTFFGKPLYVSDFAPEWGAGNKVILLANFKGYTIREDADGVIIDENPVKKNGTVEYIYKQYTDGRIMLPDCFKVLALHA